MSRFRVFGPAAAAVLLLALAGCGTAPVQLANAVAMSREQGGRFIALVGPRTQHEEPFLGVPSTNFFALRSWIDTRTGEVIHQLYVEDSYFGAKRTWNAASANGQPLRFVPITINEITCEQNCSYAEEFAAAIPEAELRNATSGLTVTFAARSGAQKTIAVPGELVRAQVVGLDRARTGLATAAAAPPATAPPRP